jgi:TonB family protein
MPDTKLVGSTLIAQSGGKVEVQVTIDESGHVKNAWLVHSAGKANSLLANVAVTAARQWIFQPATLHGKPVTAEHLIVFDFQTK